jgi:hypothetical protein
MLCIFYDHIKQIELLTDHLDVVPETKDTVVIRGIFYTVVRKTFDFNDMPPVLRVDCEVRV